jgi:hypothetical protein
MNAPLLPRLTVTMTGQQHESWSAVVPVTGS